MAFFTGRTGEVVYNSVKVAKVKDWSFEVNVNLLDTNVLGDFANTFTPGFKGATGSATLMYYRLETTDTGVQAFTAMLGKLLKKGAVTQADKLTGLLLRMGPDAKDQIRINAYITSATISIATDEVAAIPIQFTVDGDFDAATDVITA